MKIYIDFEKQAIVKITTEDLFEGDIDSNKFIVLFSNYGTNTNWYPTLTQLAPNGREAGAFNADALEDDATHEYTEDDVNYLKYEWTITNEFALQNGRSNFFIYVNTIKNGGLAKKVYAKFTCVLNESDNQYFVADPEFNPKVKQYIDTYSQLRFDGVGTEAQIEALTENKGIWLCMDDTSDYNGYFFYWDDATEQYVPGNVFQATEVADGAITWAKLAAAVQAIIDAKAEQTDVTQTITAHEIKTDLVSPKTATSKLELGSTNANISIRDNDENTTYVNIFSDYNTYVSGNDQLILESDNDVKIRALNDNTKIELTENNVNITAPTTTIGKPSKGKIQVGDDIKFIADGSSQMASVDDDGFHAGDFVIAYDTIKSENGSFDIESANGDTKIHIDDDEVDISTPTENINLYDKEIEIKIDGTLNQTITLAEDSGNEGSLKTEIQNDTGQSSLFEQYSYGIKFHLYDDGSETDDALIELYDDGVYWNNYRLATEHQVNDEATIRFNADNNLQSQIDGLNAGQNLADIVADLTALNNLSITNLKNGDKVQVLVDSDHDNESTVYSLSISGSTHTWNYIGMYGKSSYTKAEEDVKFAQIHDILALKEGIDNKVTSLSSSSTNQQYPSAKCVYDALVLKADLTNSYQVITADKVKVNEVRDLTGSGNVNTKYTNNSITNEVKYGSYNYNQVAVRDNYARLSYSEFEEAYNSVSVEKTGVYIGVGLPLDLKTLQLSASTKKLTLDGNEIIDTNNATTELFLTDAEMTTLISEVFD